MTCTNTECVGAVQPWDRYCRKCGTKVLNVRGAAPPPETVAAAPPQQEPFFSHAPRRTAGPLSSATRLLCAAAYLNRPFANRVIRELLATRRAVAPSVNFDVGPVLRHCLRARRNILIRDVVLVIIVAAGLIIKAGSTLLFLLFALGLSLLPRVGRRRRGLMGRLGLVAGTAAGVAFALALLSFLVFGGSGSFLGWPNSLLGRLPGLFRTGGWPFATESPLGYSAGAGIVFPGILLLAAALVTEFAYLTSTFRTLQEGLRGGTEAPRAVSGAAEERIALVEGAQCGNVTLHGGWFPFIGAGHQTEVHWSIAIPLRRKDPGRVEPVSQLLGERPLDGDHDHIGEHVAIDPVDLHRRVRERLLSLNDQALPVNERIAGLSVSDRVVGSGLLCRGNPLLDPDLKTPYSHASREAVEALIRHPQARLRYYLQVSVSDEGPPVMSRGRKVIDGVDQEVAVSAFVYAAVEGRMFYLQFVLTALLPIDDAYRVIKAKYGRSLAGRLTFSMKRLFGSVIFAPAGLLNAFRLWRTERRVAKRYLSCIDDFDFSAAISVRQLGAAPWFGRYIEELDVEKYNMMISRVLLDAVTEYLDSKGVDTSSFESRAQNIINGDINYIRESHGRVDQFGGRGNTHKPSPDPAGRSQRKSRYGNEVSG